MKQGCCERWHTATVLTSHNTQVFGELVEGDDVLKLIESCGREPNDVEDGKPTYSVVIADCGLC
jgi:hypothetical protein